MVLVECFDHGCGDDLINSAIRSLKWGYRLLWLSLFIGLIVPMGYLASLRTWSFFGALFFVTIPLLFSRKELIEVLEQQLNTEEAERILEQERIETNFGPSCSIPILLGAPRSPKGVVELTEEMKEIEQNGNNNRF